MVTFPPLHAYSFFCCPGGKSRDTYDPLHRNPLFCGADHTTLWELQRVSLKTILGASQVEPFSPYSALLLTRAHIAVDNRAPFGTQSLCDERKVLCVTGLLEKRYCTIGESTYVVILHLVFPPQLSAHFHPSVSLFAKTILQVKINFKNIYIYICMGKLCAYYQNNHTKKLPV